MTISWDERLPVRPLWRQVIDCARAVGCRRQGTESDYVRFKHMLERENLSCDEYERAIHDLVEALRL